MNFFEKKYHSAEKLKGGILWGFSTSELSQNIKKLQKFFLFPGKNVTMPKKPERGDPLGFFNIHSVAKHQKNAGGTLWGKNSEKNVSQCRKKIERGDPLMLPGMVCYAEKQGKPFWSSSLGQMVQFDTIIFGRTFQNYFGQFMWIEIKESL